MSPRGDECRCRDCFLMQEVGHHVPYPPKTGSPSGGSWVAFQPVPKTGAITVWLQTPLRGSDGSRTRMLVRTFGWWPSDRDLTQGREPCQASKRALQRFPCRVPKTRSASMAQGRPPDQDDSFPGRCSNHKAIACSSLAAPRMSVGVCSIPKICAPISTLE